MRSIMELSRKQAELANETDTSTTGLTDTQPTIWKSEVIKFGESLRRLDQFVIHDTTLLNKPGEIVRFNKSTGHQSITTTQSAEAGNRTSTEMTLIDTVDITVASADFLLGQIIISKQLLKTSAIDLIKEARYVIAEDMADDVELKLASANGYQTTTITNEVFGGASANADASDLAAGDVLTVDMIPDAMAKLEANDWVPKVLVIGPYQKAALLKDPQFTNASEYGSNEVVMKGEIGTYLGLKVITTTNTNLSNSSAGTDLHDATVWAVAGYTCLVIGVNRQGLWPVALVWKEKPHIDMEYKKDKAAWYIYYDQAFESGLIHKEGVCLIKVTNA